MKILLVPTTDWIGHPFPSRLHHIFEKIAEHNEVHVLRFAFYPEKRLETKLIVHEIDDFKNENLALYYLTNAHKHYKAIYEIAKENDVDVVVISNLLAGYIAAKAVGGRFRTIFDLSDHFPSSGAGYYFNVNSTFGKLATFCLEKILKATLKHVNCTITCSHALRDYVKKFGVSNVHVIPNGVDDFFFLKNNGDAVRKKYGLNGYVTVGYIGSIEFWLNMFPLLRAMHALSRDHKLKLMLVGSRLRTKTQEIVRKEIENLGIKNSVVWLDFVPYHDVPGYIEAMDICTIPFDLNHPTAFYSAPNKMLEYLALGKTVIASPIPEILLSAKNCVELAVTANDYVRTIEDYIENREDYLKKAEKGKRLAMQLTWENLAKKYESILEETLSS